MLNHIIYITIYIVSVLLAMFALQAFDFEHCLRKGRMREFYVFYIMASIALGYLFAQFIINFGTLSFY